MKFGTDTEVKILYCYKCDYETVGANNLEAHALLLHGIVKCDRCEYAAEDFDILNEHKKKHTGRIIFQCGKCEFEATRQAILENHMEEKHSRPLTPPEREMCNHCERYFLDPLLLKYHPCKPVECEYRCERCSFIGKSSNEYLQHLETHKVQGCGEQKNNISPEIISCPFCNIQLEKSDNLRIHLQNVHNARDEFNCDTC